MTNDDLIARGVDTNDEWIKSRVGIAERHYAAADETVVDMAHAAAANAVTHSGVPADQIDLVIVATCTMPTPVPAAAPQLAFRLGIDSPGAFDVNSGCSGFVYALNVASAAVLAGQARHALVVASERFSGWLDYNDRTTCIILGDGAGAVVVGPHDEVGIGPVVWGSDGEQFDAVAIDERTRVFRQEGQAVYRWATSKMAPVALAALDQRRRQARRARRVRPPPGQPAHHRRHRQAPRRRERGGRARHRHVGQHVGGDDPSRLVAHGRGRRDPLRFAGPAPRLRLRTELRRPGRAGPVTHEL